MSETMFQQGHARIGKGWRAIRMASLQGWWRAAAVLVISGVVVALYLIFPACAALAQGGGEGQTYYIPLPETQLRESLDAIFNPGAVPPGYDVMSVISIVPVVDSSLVPDSTVIYYDHWEDGYEGDIESPVQATTEVWGDGNPANGAPPGFPTDPPLGAGDVVTLENEVFVNPRDTADILYDGGDKFYATYRLAVSRAEWARDPGTRLAGAVEVSDVSKYGTHFDVPVGEDLFANDPLSTVMQMFEYVSLFVMAERDGTVVQVDTDGDTAIDIVRTLDQGASLHVDGGIQTGASVSASGPVQVDLITGDINPTGAPPWGELRWYMLLPTGLWGDSYYSAVGSRAGGNTDIWLFNPNPTDIAVTAETGSGVVSFAVSAGGVYSYRMPGDSGAHFFSVGGEVFFALATVDSASEDWDWGFTLLPESSLSTMAVVGWGPGHDLSYTGPGGPWENRSPLWLTAVTTTTVYVDYDGDPSTGPLVDPQLNSCDVISTVNRFESVRFYDDTDGDQTGMRAYTADGTLITAAWGEEMGTGYTANPYLDLGTTVIPVSLVRSRKYAMLAGDLNGNGLVDPGDTVAYSITVSNIGTGIAGNTVVSATISDDLAANASYVPGSALLNQGSGPAPIPDNVPPATVFPLDEGGYWINGLVVSNPTSVTFDVVVNNPFQVSAAGCSVVNGVRVNSSAGDGADWVMLPVTVSLDLDIDKTVEPSPPVAWEPFTYVLNLTNYGPMSATLVLTDVLPPDHFYFAGSGVPSEPDVVAASALVWQNLGPVNPGGSVAVTYQVTVTPGISGTFLNASEVYAVCPCGATRARAQVPTAAELLYFRAAAASERRVRLEWATSVELDNFGFNLYRAAVADRSAASRLGFVPSRAHGGGATYAYEDVLPADGLWWYWLSDVDTSGRETFHGPVSVGMGANVWQQQLFLPVVLRQR